MYVMSYGKMRSKVSEYSKEVEDVTQAMLRRVSKHIMLPNFIYIHNHVPATHLALIGYLFSSPINFVTKLRVNYTLLISSLGYCYFLYIFWHVISSVRCICHISYNDNPLINKSNGKLKQKLDYLNFYLMFKFFK